jgi:spermidine synthase
MPALILLALLAQLLSGAAAIVNQTVWQRSLIVGLAGSEAISSMIVILAFMAGLGAGALWIGRTAHRIRNPARALALVELTLALANLLVLGLLSVDTAEGLQQFQRLTFSLGIPLRLTYATVSAAVLFGPCFLMGVTSPLMSEVAQRQLKRRDNRFLVVLFFVNTVGAFGGGLATGFLLMPILGQRGCLTLAIALNAVAGLVILGLVRLPSLAVAARTTETPNASGAPAIRGMRTLAFAVGFLALAYEMYLYRVVALSFEPKPYTFATVLCFYLLWWSIGVLLARWMPWNLAYTLVATAAATLVAPLLADYPWPASLDVKHAVFALGFWLPCLGFGAAFGQLVIRVAVNWGNDVGRFYGWNTIGACTGIVAGVLVGYEAPPTFMLLTISFGYLVLAGAVLAAEGRRMPAARPARALAAAAAVTLGLWASELGVLMATLQDEGARHARTYYGPEGVVEVRGGRHLVWNGLGHAVLSENEDHVGNHNWSLAVAPLLAHAPGRAKDALIVGLGGGTTVGTLARSSTVRAVDAYEINPDLELLLSDFPEGTLHVGTNPKITMLWQDGRTGLTLSSRRYDIITQQPLYLKQAGSSILLSREYMELVRSRLKPGGVFCIYSNAQGHLGQALIVRQTVAGVFRYCESFLGGYLLLTSDSPIAFDAASIERALAASGPLDIVANEVRRVGIDTVAAWHDRPRLAWSGSPVIITDDHPVVEYPELADRLVAAHQSRRQVSRARQQ